MGGEWGPKKTPCMLQLRRRESRFCGGGALTRNTAVVFLLTDHEVLRAEDPHAKRVLRGLRRAARLSKRIHAEGNENGQRAKVRHPPPTTAFLKVESKQVQPAAC